MKAAILLLALVFAASAAELDFESTFQNWRVQNHKFYANANEYQKRYNIFVSNLKRVVEFNSEKHSFQVGMNYFADLENSEFRALYTMGPNTIPRKTSNAAKFTATGAEVPDSVDWRSQGIVNPVKDQGQCGSCWSFGANAGMEGAYAQATGKLVSMSEQNILDCSWDLGNEGCNGGWHYSAMDYVIKNNGIDSEASYPYTAKSSYTCKFDKANVVGSIKSYSQVQEGDESDLQKAVSQGVVSIAIDASNWSFQMYKNGVYDEAACSPQDLDHAVAIVGYGSDNNVPMWIVRNSWGTSWGMAGYIEMSRNKDNQCGIATSAYLPKA